MQVLVFLFFIIIFLQLLYVTQGFNNLPNLDFNDINTVNLSILTMPLNFRSTSELRTKLLPIKPAPPVTRIIL